MRMKKMWRPGASVFVFSLIFVASNLALYQKPLLIYAISTAELALLQAWLQFFSLQFAQALLIAGILLFFSALSIILLKLVVSAIAVVNAIALYFMLNYHVALDRTMVASLLNTNARETTEIWHISIIPYLLILGVMPTILIWWIKIRPMKRVNTLLNSVGAFVILAFWLFATSGTWLGFDQQGSQLRNKALPWSYLVNTTDHVIGATPNEQSQQLLRNEQGQFLLPKAQFQIESPARKQVVLLMIGESARAENFTLYGYSKPTNAFTASTSLFALPVGFSCATNTIASAACILSHEGRAAPPKTIQEPLPSYLTRHGIETIFRTNSAGPPPVTVTRFERPKDILAKCNLDNCPNPKQDEALNWNLAKILNSSTSNRIFLTIHHYGSHGPAYFKRYPTGFDYFKPECKTVKFLTCSDEELLNAYDNSIRYTDFLLADLIAQLKTLDADSVLIYTSDHGESFGEGGFYVHGTPTAIAPKQQREIPFLVWMSDGFRQQRGLTYADILPDKSYPHDFPFHSVMGAFGMRSEIYKPEYDIFNPKP